MVQEIMPDDKCNGDEGGWNIMEVRIWKRNAEMNLKEMRFVDVN
jgi:hypothetical protein